MLKNITIHLQYRKTQNQKNHKMQLLINQKLLKTQTLLKQNQLLQKTQKLHINYPRLKDKLKK